MRRSPRPRDIALRSLLVFPAAIAADAGAEGTPETSATVTGYYYVMRDQPDFGVGVASFNRGALHLEARYNYEAHNATSLFAGWRFSGGEALTFEATPIVGTLFGSTRAFVPGLEASVAYRAFDAYVEAEYVRNRDDSSASYYYAWTELGWSPVQWLRIGLVAQRTKTVEDGRDLQRGAFAQLIWGKATFSIYGFNPASARRYAIVSLGAEF
jgi:hypothetical protein